MKNLGRLLALSCLLTGVARADVPPTSTEPCVGKTAGMDCRYIGQAGTCQDETCTKLDYSNWTQETPSPPTTTYACVLCVPKNASPTTTGTSTGTGTDPNDRSDGGCHLGGLSVRRVVPWLLAGGFSLLFLFARRRRTR